MSKYLTYSEVLFADEHCLIAALTALGYPSERGESLPLVGYHGDTRPETAQIVVRRTHLSAASNDLGFAKGAKGYMPIISEYDQRALRGGRLLTDLKIEYQRQVVTKIAARHHVKPSITTEGTLLKLVVRW